MEFTKDIFFSSQPQSNETLEIRYNGYLSNSLELWIVYGFGQTWENTTEIKMEKINNQFVANINILEFDTFNFCFKNSYNQWDNNYGSNFVSNIQPSYTAQIVSLFDELFEDSSSTFESKEVQNVNTFDIDQLIEELLQPIIEQASIAANPERPEILESVTDLGEDVSKLLSDIECSDNVIAPTTEENLLAADVIAEQYINLTNNSNDKVSADLAEELTNDSKSYLEEVNDSIDINNISFEYTQDLSESTNDSDLSIPVDSKFAISPRKLSKFYLFRKRIILFFSKAFLKLPEKLFGTNN